jgi:microcystin-dependent protein
MADPFLGEIKMFGGNFAPRGFALCDGQLLAISQNSALFSLFGTIYGGDGLTTFGLPDLRGRVPVHMGSGPGLTPRPIGAKGGAEGVNLTQTTTPSHSHQANATTEGADSAQPGGALFAQAASEKYATGGATQPMDAAMVQNAGGGQAHDNMAPFQAVYYIVALQGVFPSRS